MIKIILAAMFILLASVVRAAVNAEVDRTRISEGESFTLLLTSYNDDSKPDLNILTSSFDVLSLDSKDDFSNDIVKGELNNIRYWTIRLMPKQMGTIIIPSITIGNERTSPITIEVIKNSIPNNIKANIFPAQKNAEDEFNEWQSLAEGGDVTAQKLMGGVYEIGYESFPQDYTKAYMWYSISATNGDKNAKSYIGRLTMLMKAEEIEQAQQMARDWLAKHPKNT